MSVRDVHDWLRALVPGVALVVLTAISSIQVISAAETRKTSEDRFAEQDIRDAQQDIDRMHRILGAELQRLTSGSGGSESDEVLPYLQESSGKPINLGDVRIPLSTRYTERERRQMVAAIALFKAEMAEACGNPTPGDGNQLLDAAFRVKVLAALRCHQHQLDRIQSGLHKILQGYEASVVQLKLPPFTQEKMLAEAHAYALKQDSDLASNYAHPRQVWQANVDFFTYLNEHAAHARYIDNQILFDDPAETQAAQELLARLKAASQ
jgi:hypothetical protein